ncbi:DUF3857 domain-containing protein [Flavobacterium amnicola]|uniref:DUF3857 domain-containing protein n=1 Tax=Flavobacterium amnicola TaxID=2506422 RepID=A0A4Q1K9R0_9FLAO|nr:DUF3857 domain-containing protein [Flavobacterium amnicola]RXR21359.1 DUF3857 domain-containing protein [Flavobacterium amnicola]
MKINYCFLFIFFSVNVLLSQSIDFSVNDIPNELNENANSVIRDQRITVEIKSISNMIIKSKKVTTVLNEKGYQNIDAFEYYDKSSNVTSIEATIFNSYGNEIKKLKRKDFFDQSIVDGSSEVSDTRVMSLVYTPTEYPFTIVYESEIQTNNTAFIPKLFPVNDFYESVQKSTFRIDYPSKLGFKYKEINLENCKFIKKQLDESLQYEFENLIAVKKEELSDYNFPRVLFGLNQFMLEGVEGNASNWKNFGLWVNEKLLKDTQELSQETKNKIIELTKNESDVLKKARIIYQYVQNKTRYISIQLGIGGWKPMLAKNVDRLGYGDCKALSNYTKALLDVVGIKSYYAIIYGGVEREDIQEDIVSMQGNHAVLAIPNNEKLYFLECTSQTKPFGFEGDFTDNRVALLITPEGGELVRTKKYIDQDNAQISNAKIVVDSANKISIVAEIKSTGIQYDRVVEFEKFPTEKAKELYKYRFSNVKQLSVESIKFNNDKTNVQFIENVVLSVYNYIENFGNEKLFALNMLNQNNEIPQRYRNRKNDFEIDNGFYDLDNVEIELPKTYKIVSQPENIKIDSKFGTYNVEISVLSSNRMLYKRELLIKKGNYLASEYEDYRKFRELVAKNDNLKTIIQE